MKRNSKKQNFEAENVSKARQPLGQNMQPFSNTIARKQKMLVTLKVKWNKKLLNLHFFD